MIMFNFRSIITFICVLICNTVCSQQLHMTVHNTVKNSLDDYLGQADLEIKENAVTGKIVWTIIKLDPRNSALKMKMSSTAIEFISGTYDLVDHKLSFQGMSKKDPDNIIGLDVYKLILSSDNNVNGTTRGSGTWDGLIKGVFSANTDLFKKPDQPSILPGDEPVVAFIRNRADKIAYTIREGSHRMDIFKRSENYRVIERHADNTPKTIRFDIIYDYDYKTDPQRISVNVMLKNKLPYACYPVERSSPDYFQPFPTDYQNLDYSYPKMSVSTAAKIDELYANYSKSLDPNYLSNKELFDRGKKVSDSLTNLIKKRFPGKDCFACLVKKEDFTTSTKAIKDVGFFGQEDATATTTNSNYTLTNKCNKPLKAIGIERIELASGKQQYKIIFLRYKPNQVFKWSNRSYDEKKLLSTSEEHGRAHNGDGQIFDISIDPVYDTGYGSSAVQFLRIIEDK